MLSAKKLYQWMLPQVSMARGDSSLYTSENSPRAHLATRLGSFSQLTDRCGTPRMNSNQVLTITPADIWELSKSEGRHVGDASARYTFVVRFQGLAFLLVTCSDLLFISSVTRAEHCNVRCSATFREATSSTGPAVPLSSP